MKQSIMFHSADELREWFRENHKSVPGLWIRLKYEPAEGDLTQEEALHTAICFGWVDDRIKRIDDTFYRKSSYPAEREAHGARNIKPSPAIWRKKA